MLNDIEIETYKKEQKMLFLPEGNWSQTLIAWAPALVVGLIALSTLNYYLHVHLYWSKRNIKGDKPLWLFSEFYEMFFKNRQQLQLERVRKYGKIYGTYRMGRPYLVVADAEVIRQITVRDFDVFQNHKSSEWANKYQRNFLVWRKDDEWRRARAMISPQFTSSKMKRMYKLLDGCAEDLLENFREQLIAARREQHEFARVDLFATYSLYTMDGITTCCYGLKLARERGDQDIKRASARQGLVRDCQPILTMSLWRILTIGLVPKSLLHAIQFKMSPEGSLMPIIKRLEKLIELRRQGNTKATSKYDDFLQMLIDARLDDELELSELDQAENHHASLTHDSLLKDQAKLVESQAAQAAATTTSQATAQKHKALAKKMSDIDILSEALLLMAAGLDTTRSSMSTITYLLAHNLPVQERLYQELTKIVHYEDTPVGKLIKFNYDTLTSCQYLDAVISESLRFFGPVMFTDRDAARDYLIEKYQVPVAKGSQVLLGLHAVHHDPEYWHEPERFDPDRFMPGQREKIIPGSYVPFSMGPRHCVGMRFSLTETKLGLAKVLMRFKFSPAPNTKYPPEPKLGVSLVSVKNCHVLCEYRDSEWN